MKIVFEREIDGVQTLISAVTAPGNQGYWVKVLVPIGNPYWMWDQIPAGQVIAADFTGAPLSTNDVALNNSNIAAITALPEDVLTYAP